MTFPPQPAPDREPDEAEVGRLLDQANAGDDSAFDRLIPLVYDELRLIAHRHRMSWKGNETVGTTALVHEAYVKLVQGVALSTRSRAHFLAVASRAMRQILIDHARGQQAGKRGGGLERVSFEVVREIAGVLPEYSAAGGELLVALDESLQRLEAESPRHSRIVECRFFGGMTVDETAEALDVSAATVKRGWSRAQAWLHRDLSRDPGGATPRRDPP